MPVTHIQLLMQKTDHSPLITTCQRCGQCCKSLTENGRFSLPLSRQDAEKISKLSKFKDYKKLGKIKIIKSTFDGLYDKELSAKGFCPFLDPKTFSCEIYDQGRPSTCINFQCY
jgi:Fe-S-cluster containining protein